MPKDLVWYNAKDGVAMIVLHDPPMNTYTHEMMLQLDAAILKARFDKRVYAIVIRGDGEKAFCAGANIDMLQQSDPYFKYFFCLHANETLSRLEQTPKITIAAINGACVGGGLEIAMACDIRIAHVRPGEKQIKFGLPEVNLGVMPGTGGTQRFARLVGKPMAIKLMTTGELYDVHRAYELGIVTDLVEAKDGTAFLAEIWKRASEYCPPSKAAFVAGAIKRSVQSGAEVPLEYGLAIERELQARCFGAPDAKEGLDAYVEKQKPRFTGRP